MPETPEDLKNHQCLLYSYADSAKNWTLENDTRDQVQVQINGSFLANNGNLMCDAMIHGMGIALLPTFIVGDALKSGKAIVILNKWRQKSSDISLLYPSSKHLSVKVRAFVDMAVEHFKGDWIYP
jgi:DNA-binding transcriptional LysR family regulator